jgi:hypothetical protein
MTILTRDSKAITPYGHKAMANKQSNTRCGNRAGKAEVIAAGPTVMLTETVSMQSISCPARAGSVLPAYQTML